MSESNRFFFLILLIYNIFLIFPIKYDSFFLSHPVFVNMGIQEDGGVGWSNFGSLGSFNGDHHKKEPNFNLLARGV